MLDGVVSRFICLFDAAAAYGGYATPLDAPVARAGLRSAADARSLNLKYRIARTIDVQSALGLHSLRAQRVQTITRPDADYSASAARRRASRRGERLLVQCSDVGRFARSSRLSRGVMCTMLSHARTRFVFFCSNPRFVFFFPTGSWFPKGTLVPRADPCCLSSR